MTDRPAPGYTPARGEAKFPDLTLHKHVPFHRDSFIRLAVILFDWRYIEPRLVRRRCRPGRLVHSARAVIQ